MAVRTRNYDLVAAVIGLILGAVVLLLHFLKTPNEYLISMGTLMIASCLFYLLFRGRLLKLADTEAPAGAGRHYILLINIVFTLVLAASIFTLQVSTTYRSLGYFLLTAVACAIIAVEIILSPGNKSQIFSILVKIFIISLSLRASQYFGFASIVGVDPWSHYEILRDLLAEGHMQPVWSFTGQADTYYNYPVFHLYTGMMRNITDTSLKDAMFLAIALPEVLGITFLFLLGRKLIGVQGGLLAALMMAFSDFHIQWGAQIIPMTLGVTLVFLLLYIFMVQETYGKPLVIRFLTIFLFAMVVLTHTVTAFVLLVSVFVLFVMPRLYRLLYRSDTRSEYVSVTLMALAFAGIMTQWIYAAFGSDRFFNAIVRGLSNSILNQADFLARPEVSGPQGTSMLNDAVLNISGFAILFAFGVIGGLLYLSRRYQDVNRVTIITLAAVLFSIPFGFSLFGIRNILPYRWFVFMYLPLVTAASFAIIKILALFPKTYLKVATVTALMAVFSFFMITSTMSNTDNPLYKAETTTRLVYTTREMNIAGTLSRYYDGVIVTDGYYSLPFRYFHYTGDLPRFSEFWIEDGLPGGIIVWRDHMRDTPVLMSGKTGRDAWVLLAEGYEEQLGIERNLVYGNPQVKAYQSR